MARGIVRETESERLKFLALAEHARAVGREPSRLFAVLLRRERWHFITQDDEDRASERLKRFVYGEYEKPESGRGWSARAALSRDALLVRQLRTNLQRAGFSGDAFLTLSKEFPEWTRERWERAVAELEGGQRAAA